MTGLVKAGANRAVQKTVDTAVSNAIKKAKNVGTKNSPEPTRIGTGKSVTVRKNTLPEESGFDSFMANLKSGAKSAGEIMQTVAGRATSKVNPDSVAAKLKQGLNTIRYGFTEDNDKEVNSPKPKPKPTNKPVIPERPLVDRPVRKPADKPASYLDELKTGINKATDDVTKGISESRKVENKPKPKPNNVKITQAVNGKATEVKHNPKSAVSRSKEPGKFSEKELEEASYNDRVETAGNYALEGPYEQTEEASASTDNISKEEQEKNYPSEKKEKSVLKETEKPAPEEKKAFNNEGLASSVFRAKSRFER